MTATCAARSLLVTDTQSRARRREIKEQTGALFADFWAARQRTGGERYSKRSVPTDPLDVMLKSKARIGPFTHRKRGGRALVAWLRWLRSNDE